MLTLTKSAAEHLFKELQKREALGIRIGIKKTGCSGFAYTVEYADIIESFDHIIKTEGITLVVDPKSLPYIRGSEIDYVRQGLNAGLQFSNPNSKGTCGCGESFNI